MDTRLTLPSGEWNKVLFVGEFPDNKAVKTGIPFQGASSRELEHMLDYSDITWSECAFTYVFHQRPQDGKIENWCKKKAEVGGKNYPVPAIKNGKYIVPELLSALDRLAEEINEIKPNLVIALGGTATWALLNDPRITAHRGTVIESTLCPGVKVLPTYSPGAAFRDYSLRASIIMDLQKASIEATFPEVIRPRRILLIEPTLAEVRMWCRRLVDEGKRVAFDVETRDKTITAISLTNDKHYSICIPFYDSRKPSNSYWPTFEEEFEVWNLIDFVLSSDNAKLAQNGIYDITYLWKGVGIEIHGPYDDTMIMQHSLQPELPKSLGFLGSIYTNESSWKNLGKRSKTTKGNDA